MGGAWDRPYDTGGHRMSVIEMLIVLGFGASLVCTVLVVGPCMLASMISELERRRIAGRIVDPDQYAK